MIYLTNDHKGCKFLNNFDHMLRSLKDNLNTSMYAAMLYNMCLFLFTFDLLRQVSESILFIVILPICCAGEKAAWV